MKKKIILIIVGILMTLLLFIAAACTAFYFFNPFAEELPVLTKDKPFKLIGQVNKEKIDIGDPFTYTVTLYKLKDLKVNLDKKDIKKDKDQFKNLNVIDIKEDVKDYDSKNIQVIKYIYYLQPTDIVGIKIPSIKAVTSKVISTLPVVNVPINSVLTNPDKMKDVHDIKPLDKYFIINLWYTLLGLLSLLLIAIIIAIIINWKRKAKVEKEIKVYKPPHIIAYEQLALLKKMDLKTQKDYKVFYTKLSEIFRIYLEGRFKIQAIEKTSEEINAEMARIKFNMKTRNLAKAILRQSDMVKFAKAIPTREIAFSSIEKTFEFVESTKQEYVAGFH